MLLEVLSGYIDRGFAVVPIPPRRKFPIHDQWNKPGGFFTSLPEASAWWATHPDDNFGAVLELSRVCSLDADHAEHTRSVLAELGLDLDALIRDYPTIQGRSDRYRVTFRAPTGVTLSRKVLTWPYETPPEDGRKEFTVFELRGGPIQDVLPPSIHPDTLKPYRWLTPLPEGELPELPAELLELWRNWDSYKESLQEVCPWSTPKEKPTPKRSTEGVSVIAEFNRAHDVESLLAKHGYTRKGKRWLAPSSSTRIPGVSVKEGKVFSHHGADPLSDGYAHDAFDLYRILEQDGDFKAAVREAAKLMGMDYKPKDNPRQESPPPEDEAWPDPEPLPDALKPVKRFVPELLPEPFQPWVRDVSERMQCAPDYAGTGAMVALSAVVGRKVGIHPKQQDDWLVVPNLWGAGIGRPSAMKTPAQEDVLKPLKRLEIEAKEQFEAALLAYTAESGLLDLKREGAKKEAQKCLREGNEPGARAVLLATAQEVPVPARRRYLVNDATVEKLGEILNENPHGVLLVRDELSGFFKTIDREDRSNDRAFYLQCFNGTGRYTYDRIGRGTIDIESLTVSILGGIQPAKFLPYIAGAVKGTRQDDGMMQRFQLAVYPDLPQDWQYVDRWPDKAARKRAYEVFRRLAEWTPAAGEDAEIPAARFDEEAQALFKEWLTDLETEVRSEDIHPALEAHFTKYRKLIPALALLIHLAELAHRNTLPERADTLRVGKAAFIKAAAWGEYLKSHAERIYALGIYSDTTNAKTLLAKLKAGRLKSPVKLRVIQQAGWSGLTEWEAIRKALALLTEQGYLRAEEIRTGERGRPSVIYHVHPALLGEEDHG